MREGEKVNRELAESHISPSLRVGEGFEVGGK